MTPWQNLSRNSNGQVPSTIQADLEDQRRQQMNGVNTGASRDGQESDQTDPTSLCANGKQPKQCHAHFPANNWHPYKMQMLQNLTQDDPDYKVEFCEWTLDMHENVPDQNWLERLSLCVDLETWKGDMRNISCNCIII
ncbi:hypothetical protein AVEN_246353-1 [Araneus ventricosus]|uniref:Uncharacterized protein n=1 Tax=Araneus ventricosus TaxID=182803 RepID=A0A4Y2JC10_ARAVE|nr:hypothetical protein AVEN_246353-1 [Araneus ventricosus]